MTESFREQEVAALRQNLARSEREAREVNDLYIAEGLKRRTADARVVVLEAALRKAISECDECGGHGFNTMDDGQGGTDKDPCNTCWDYRQLLNNDSTDYVLHPIGEEPAPAGTCQKTELCILADGHEGECDDIPF